MQFKLISSAFRVSQLHWLDRKKNLGMTFHTVSLKGTFFAQEKFWGRLGAGLCL